MRARRWADALPLLRSVAASDPQTAEARYLYGVTLRSLGQIGAAETQVRAAIALDGRQPPFFAELGTLLAATDRRAEAEEAWRRSLSLDPGFKPAIMALSELLCAAGRAEEAVTITAPMAAAPNVDEAGLAAYAEALKSAGKDADRLKVYQRSAQAFPRSGVAEHNVATSFCDLGFYPEAEAAIARSVQKGMNRPETWLVLGRAQQGQDRFDEAKASYQKAIDQRPTYALAHTELAQLVWMQTGDAAAASEFLDAAIEAHPTDPSLRLAKSQVHAAAGETAAAYESIAEAAKSENADLEIQLAAARAALSIDPVKSLEHAEAALARSRWNRDAAELALCEALFANGLPQKAEPILEDLRRRRPQDQHVIAYQATAWRLLNDQRYHALYDYSSLVKSWRVEPPPGWSTTAEFLAELKAALQGLHRLRAHPLNQSVRHGTQTRRNLLNVDDPVIGAFFAAADPVIRRYISELGEGADPFRSRSAGGYAMAGAWSVQLHPGGGRHIDHVHPKGWISSAFYVDLPSVVGAGGKEGWLQFGAPGTPTSPSLPAEFDVRPEPGLLVLFPSYMWHGTLPFTGEARRLSLAFDATPGEPPPAR